MRTYSWSSVEDTFAAKMRWVSERSEVALPLRRFHVGYVMWGELQDAIRVLFMMLISWMLQLAAQRFHTRSRFASPWNIRFGRSVVVERCVDDTVSMVVDDGEVLR